MDEHPSPTAKAAADAEAAAARQARAREGLRRASHLAHELASNGRMTLDAVTYAPGPGVTALVPEK